MIPEVATEVQRAMTALAGLSAIRRADTHMALETALLEAMRPLGVETYSTVVLVNPSRIEPEKFLVSNWPDEWRKTWLERKFYVVDGVGLQALSQPGAFQWRDLDPRCRAIGKDVFEGAKHFGIVDGFTLSTHHGGKALISVSVSSPHLEWTDIEDGVARVLADAYIKRLMEVRDLDVTREYKKLSPRERECLYLVAAGLSDKEIAREIKLTPNTVTQYLKNICQKLHASSRASAVATAIWRGELAP